MEQNFNTEDFIKESKKIEELVTKAFPTYNRPAKGKLLYEPKGKKYDYIIEICYRVLDKEEEKVFIKIYTTLKDVKSSFEAYKNQALEYCKTHKGQVITGVLYNKDRKELDAWCVR